MVPACASQPLRSIYGQRHTPALLECPFSDSVSARSCTTCAAECLLRRRLALTGCHWLCWEGSRGQAHVRRPGGPKKPSPSVEVAKGRCCRLFLAKESTPKQCARRWNATLIMNESRGPKKRPQLSKSVRWMASTVQRRVLC